MAVLQLEPETDFSEIAFQDDFKIRTQAIESLTRRIRESSYDARDVLASFVPYADEHQDEVIQAVATTMRVVAPAGSGKTQTVVNRVLHRVRDGINPATMLVLTFDNSACSSLKAMFEENLAHAQGVVEQPPVQTLNAYGYAILRKHFPQEASEIIEDWQQFRIMRQLRAALAERSPERAAAIPAIIGDAFLIEFFSLLKNNLFDPREIDANAAAAFVLDCQQAEPFFVKPEDETTVRMVIQAVLWLFQAHECALRAERKIDFDDQKLRPYTLLKKNRPLLEVLQGQLHEIIVDEFQDINLLDFSLIKMMADKATLVVTGDDDQAIYGFRGCSPDFIIRLEQHLGCPVASYELRMNYRCPPAIVKHADRLIRHNKVRIPKQPIAVSSSTADIKVISSGSAGIEARTIVSLIQHIQKSSNGISWRDFAVLYRTNAQSLPFQIELILNDIPYHVRREDNILENEVLEKLLGVLRLKIAYATRSRQTVRDRVLTIQAYFRMVRPGAVAQLEDLFRSDTDFGDLIRSRQFLNIVPQAEQSAFYPRFVEMLGARSLLDTLDVVGQKFKGLQGMIGSLEDAIQEKVPLGEIKELAANFHGNVEEFVSNIENAITRARQGNAGNDPQHGVSLRTYFKSKGLQWHTVVLTTCNEGLIPHSRAPIEDERRLFYVAMTRASSNLVLSYVANAVGTQVRPSRFLYEAGLLSK